MYMQSNLCEMLVSIIKDTLLIAELNDCIDNAPALYHSAKYNATANEWLAYNKE